MALGRRRRPACEVSLQRKIHSSYFKCHDQQLQWQYVRSLTSEQPWQCDQARIELLVAPVVEVI